MDTDGLVSAGFDPAKFLVSYTGRVTQLHMKNVAAGVRHFYVEQEPPFTSTRLEAVAKSYNYFAKLVA